MKIQCTAVKHLSDMDQFDASLVINIESLDFGYVVWHRVMI